MVDSKKIIVALDYNDINDALKLSDNIDSNLCRIKIGKELFTKYGPKIVRDIQARGFEVFLDLKFHDIPTTVYKACISAMSMDVWMINIHLSGGINMSLAAQKAKIECQSSCKLIGVTVLTSLSDDDCLQIYGCTRQQQLAKFKKFAIEADLDGFVCSPYDIEVLEHKDKIYVTPGIRIDNDSHDHAKIIKPETAIELGSSYLVIGRSITNSISPNNVIQEIMKVL